MNVEISEELRQRITMVLLENNNLSLNKIAKAIDVSNATVSRIHNGITKSMDPRSHARLIYFLENHKELLKPNIINSPENNILNDLNIVNSPENNILNNLNIVNPNAPNLAQQKAVALTLQTHAIDKVRESMQKQLDEKDLYSKRVAAQSSIVSAELLKAKKEITRLRKIIKKAYDQI